VRSPMLHEGQVTCDAKVRHMSPFNFIRWNSCRQQPSQTQRFTAEKSWRLGVRTNKRPAHICQDLHAAFAELGIAWKHCGPYNYKCRATIRAARLQPEKSAVRVHVIVTHIVLSSNTRQWPVVSSSMSLSPVQDAMEVDNSNADSSAQLVGPRMIKFEVQVYRIKTHQYLIDVQRLEGHLYLYLDLCGELLSVLRMHASPGPQYQGQG
jgi:hypothetical protein